MNKNGYSAIILYMMDLRTKMYYHAIHFLYEVYTASVFIGFLRTHKAQCFVHRCRCALRSNITYGSFQWDHHVEDDDIIPEHLLPTANCQVNVDECKAYCTQQSQYLFNSLLYLTLLILTSLCVLICVYTYIVVYSLKLHIDGAYAKLSGGTTLGKLSTILCCLSSGVR